jgi:hypothetical protein
MVCLAALFLVKYIPTSKFEYKKNKENGSYRHRRPALIDTKRVGNIVAFFIVKAITT